MITTLVVDDSPTFRAAITAALEADKDFQVIGSAGTGAQALALARARRPALVVMDAVMPDMDGLEATRAIMSAAPCPIVMITAVGAEEYRRVAFEALEAGAVDVLAKPNLGSPLIRTQLLEHLKAMAAVRVVSRRARGPERAMVQRVVVGCSTGGPPVVRELLAALKPGFPAPVVVAQHLANGFAEGFRKWLAESIKLSVVLVSSRTALAPGTVYLADDDRHLELEGDFLVAKSAGGENAAPSVDRLFTSAAQRPDGVAAVLLTGMGVDGAKGMLELRQRGCVTFAQDEASCLVYGMPLAAVRCGAVAEQLAPSGIAMRLNQLAGGRV